MCGAGSMLDAADVLLTVLGGFEPALLSGEDCAVAAERLAAVEKACAWAKVLAAARAAACGAHRARGFSDERDWLARMAGCSRGEARAALETAEAVEGVPEAREALTAGRLSLDQAAEVVRAEARRPGCAADLVTLAARSPLAVLRDEARRIRMGSLDPDELHRRQRAARSFRHWRDSDGMVCFRGALAPEDGVPFLHRLEATCDRVRRVARREGSTEAREAHAADAFVALVEGKSAARSRGTELVVVCDLRAWRRGRTKEGEVCHLLGGGPIPVGVARELSSDAFLKAVVHDGVEIRTVRHFGRHVPAELRTALDLGPPPGFEGVACADGCGSRYGLEWDHVDPVAHGGPTSYDNLQPRCRRCHREKTERDRSAGLLAGAPP